MRELSASGLSMFRNCPKSFEYKYIQGIKRVDQAETEQLTVGKVFHSILEGDPLEAELEPKLQMSIEASADFVKNRYVYRDWETDRKSTRLNSSHSGESRMPSSA